MVNHYSRLKSGPLQNEQIRYELHPNKVHRIEYMGLAASDADVAAAVWTILKATYDGSGLLEREQVWTNVAWDSRGALG